MRITELRNVTLGLKHNPASPPMLEHYELSFTEQPSGDITWVALSPEVAAQLAERLSGGIVIAKPKLVVPGNGR